MFKLKRNLFEGAGSVTQGFGNKLIINGVDIYAKYGLKGHNGVDYGIATGTKLYSCIDGTVLEAQLDATGYGNYVKIENSYCGVLYGHMKSFSVKVGDIVKAGQLLGLSNNTGNSTGPHLHFGVYPIPRNRGNGYNGYINPFDSTQIQWVDSFEENVTEDKVSPKDKVKVSEAVNVEVEEVIVPIPEPTPEPEPTPKPEQGDTWAKDITDALVAFIKFIIEEVKKYARQFKS